ncbi:toll-like receptor 2 type-2 [Labrus mixtus]|uniref:toll-like receptor 2 type-2 n=1 Tax=Labrus mixtus TaxID=508554 RepID=UPI0029C06E55|nr:toll-like receptor 2 type-2 [Labrus mixtus]
MEEINSLGSTEIPSHSVVPLSPTIHDVPTLRDGECYHVFISYSSNDSQWTHFLIEQLESFGLQVCYHERDFTPGRTVLENMSDCIQESQKVLLVLSSEFVRSRWCLLEANMSLFRDCLERKPIVPVLLEPGVSIPLHLCPTLRISCSKCSAPPTSSSKAPLWSPSSLPLSTMGKPCSL